MRDGWAIIFTDKRAIIQYDLNGNEIQKFKTLSEASETLALDASNINKVLRGDRAQCGGFKFLYDIGPIETSINESKKITQQGNTKTLEAKTRQSITSLEEALAFFEVDLSQWQVEKYTVNSWDSGGIPQYQVKVFLKEKNEAFDLQADLRTALQNLKPSKQRFKLNGSGHGVLAITDLHIGAEVTDLLRTPDFSIQILIDRLDEIAQIVNAKRYEKVTVLNLGDLIESFSGLNHLDSWKGMHKGVYGHTVLELATNIIKDFLVKIVNLDTVVILGGNHDRVDSNNKIDTQGEVSKAIAWALSLILPNTKIIHEFMLKSIVVDDIHYILTHGHYGLSRKDSSKLIADYGRNDMFNLVLQGHLHTRLAKKSYKVKKDYYENVESLSVDELNYRFYIVPSLFTGNSYSEGLGFSGTAGFYLIENNGKGKPNVFDYTL